MLSGAISEPQLNPRSPGPMWFWIFSVLGKWLAFFTCRIRCKLALCSASTFPGCRAVLPPTQLLLLFFWLLLNGILNFNDHNCKLILNALLWQNLCLARWAGFFSEQSVPLQCCQLKMMSFNYPYVQEYFVWVYEPAAFRQFSIYKLALEHCRLSYDFFNFLD